MLDIHFIRENADVVKAGAAKKHIEVDIDRLLALDEERKMLRTKLDDGRAEQNRMSDTISKAQGPDREQYIERMRAVKDGMSELEEQHTKVLEEWQKLMLTVPNIPDMTVPEGDDDSQNVEVRSWGEKPTFDFAPKDHIELMTATRCKSSRFPWLFPKG
jgi:seryl-tRNA synthetase